jgi:hypothetical protein
MHVKILWPPLVKLLMLRNIPTRAVLLFLKIKPAAYSIKLGSNEGESAWHLAVTAVTRPYGVIIPLEIFRRSFSICIYPLNLDNLKRTTTANQKNYQIIPTLMERTDKCFANDRNCTNLYFDLW